jgi:hypothetical protein
LEKKPRAVQGPEWTSSELKRSVNPSPYWDGEELGGILRDHTPDPLGHGASGRWRNVREDMVRSAWRHAEAGRNDRPIRWSHSVEIPESNKMQPSSLTRLRAQALGPVAV